MNHECFTKISLLFGGKVDANIKSFWRFWGSFFGDNHTSLAIFQWYSLQTKVQSNLDKHQRSFGRNLKGNSEKIFFFRKIGFNYMRRQYGCHKNYYVQSLFLFQTGWVYHLRSKRIFLLIQTIFVSNCLKNSVIRGSLFVKKWFLLSF